ncbi:MAG: FmdB family transcriptional regulator [Actinomycetia bacterium]|nr:FmdB family transcriptional regulator [Actinomycetes bacterium]MCP4960953.1 FmdB family transcriptional regulator [Actinomycetes bacterium]
MPTYEYLCQSCDHQFDIYQSFSDDALTTCSECSGNLVKVFGNVGIAFKGSGFYKNDSRPGKSSSSTSSTTGNSSSSSDSSASSSSSTTSSDSSSSKSSSDSSSTTSSSSSD